MRTFGIVGNPVAHSLSPVLHRMLYEETGFEGNYSHFLVMSDEVAGIIPAMKTLGISGVNVTSPYKRDIMPFLDEISCEAAEIGAVNTVRLNENGTASGYNTDYYGFAESLLGAGIEISGKSFAVCGTSGAGKAVCYALKLYGAASVVPVSTNPANGISYSELENIRNMDVVVNCTPIGMAPHEAESPVSERSLTNFSAAVDLIYNPRETVFLRKASNTGLKTLDGLPMLVLQGIRAFALWTGIEVPDKSAKKIIDKLACILEAKQV